MILVIIFTFTIMLISTILSGITTIIYAIFLFLKNLIEDILF